MGQGYEPITRSSASDALWINAVMANLGFSSGDKFARVTAFNSWLKNSKGRELGLYLFLLLQPAGGAFQVHQRRTSPTRISAVPTPNSSTRMTAGR